MVSGLSLRAKLLLMMVGGAILLAGAITAITRYGLLSARDRAQAAARAGLEAQAVPQINALIDRSARLTSLSFASAQEVGELCAAGIVGAAGAEPNASVLAGLQTRNDGALFGISDTGSSATFVPSGVSRTEAAADLSRSVGLELFVPELRSERREIRAVVVIGQSGAMRIFPAIDLSKVDPSSQIALLDVAQTLLDDELSLWLPPVKGLELTGSADIVVPIITPVREGNTLLGAVVTYLSLNATANDLSRLAPTKRSFAFVLGDKLESDDPHTLLAAPPIGVAQLTGGEALPLSAPVQLTRPISDDFKHALDSMENGGGSVVSATIDDQRYLVGYRPLDPSGWSLGLAVPVDELTVQAEEVDRSIGEGSEDTLEDVLWSTLIFLILATVITLLVSRFITRPLTALASAARSISSGDYHQEVRVHTGDEIGAVATAFNAMITSVRRSQSELASYAEELEHEVQLRTADLQSTVGQLQEALGQRQVLAEQLRAASTPVLTIAPRVLLMPLIGSLTEDRARSALDMLLNTVEQTRARLVIVDVTGLPVVDAQVAMLLLSAAQSARLLGSETILAGIRPEVAETLVSLDLPLGQLHTAANLQAALANALRRIQT